MKLNWLCKSIGVILLFIVALVGLARQDSVIAAQDGIDKIESSLLDQVATGSSANFIIRFTDQADLSAAYSMDWDARGEFVYNTLRDTAERTQANAKTILDAQGLKYQTFIAGNNLYVWSGNQPSANGIMLLNELAALPEVSFIRTARTYTIDPISDFKPLNNITWAGDLLVGNLLTTVGRTSSPMMDWGITDTKADHFWSTFGTKGDGIVVANIDTGVQWNHPALIQAFKCEANPSDPACWAEPLDIGRVSVCNGTPCDNIGHGTHTMGTMVGSDNPSLIYTVGMAPNTQWIACKGCESDSCSDYALNSCADWILAPGGNAANRPNVVNNSWGGLGGDPWFLDKVNTWEAAGIFPTFSAGNSGTPDPLTNPDGCNTLGSPGDYQQSFGSAAHDSSRNNAYFSSRGPSAFGDTLYTKPNISAPGVNIISTVPGSIWGIGTGTSMASPHSAGAAALLWSCNPALVGNIDATFRLLQDKADNPPAGNCGAPLDGQGNFTYGYGFLNVLAAGQATCNMVTPPTLHESLQVGEAKTRNLVLANRSSSPLIWSLEEVPATFQSTSADKGEKGLDRASREAFFDVPWLLVSPITGTITVGGHIDITITFETSGLALGLYKNKLIIHSNDPYTPTIVVPVSLLVGIPTYFPTISKQ